MRLSDFDYQLPEELIAQVPLQERSMSRMLVLHRQTQRWEDRMFRDLPLYLGKGDCLTVNNSRVLPSRLYGVKNTGGANVEVLLLEPLNETDWTALVRPGKRLRIGDTVGFGEGFSAEIVGQAERGQRTLRFSNEEARSDIYDALERLGHMPLPPYIKRSDSSVDRERYQTVYARERGSSAAPTAGLHFTQDVLARCTEAGAERAEVTLHVGLGTFQPLEVEEFVGQRLHLERYRVAPEEWQKIEQAKRVVAIGTTSVRTIETVAATGELSGATDRFIYPGYSFRRVGAMLTNFHLPKTSLVLLVSAFAGQDLTLAAYRHAVEQRYRFFSYGDCMLIV